MTKALDEPEVESSEKEQLQETCVKCSRKARIDCTVRCCVNCCDDERCETHRKAKAQKEWKSQVLAGTTDVQKVAAEIRRRTIPPSGFREGSFRYTGDTVVIWDLKAYMRNPNWKEDAIRRSKRRHGDDVYQRSRRNSRKRFLRVVEDLRKKSEQTDPTTT